MKKLLTTLCLIAVSIFVAKSEPLFPFFVDLVSDYTTVTDNVTLVHHIGKTNGGGDKNAESFLKDTLPDSYHVVIDENRVGNRRIRTYSSSMTDDKTSVIYFIWEGDKFSIEYAEGPFIDVIPYCD